MKKLLAAIFQPPVPTLLGLIILSLVIYYGGGALRSWHRLRDGTLLLIVGCVWLLAPRGSRAAGRDLLRHSHNHGATAGAEDLPIGSNGYLQFTCVDPKKLRRLTGGVLNVIRNKFIRFLALIVHL